MGRRVEIGGGGTMACPQRGTQTPEPRLRAQGPRRVRASTPALQALSLCLQDTQLPPAEKSELKAAPSPSKEMASEVASPRLAWAPPTTARFPFIRRRPENDPLRA